MKTTTAQSGKPAAPQNPRLKDFAGSAKSFGRCCSGSDTPLFQVIEGHSAWDLLQDASVLLSICDHTSFKAVESLEGDASERDLPLFMQMHYATEQLLAMAKALVDSAASSTYIGPGETA